VPTLLSHLAPPLALRLGLGRIAVPGRLLAAGLLAAILPDLDVLAFRFHIPYAHILGHRGFSHSLLFALLLGLLAMAGASLLHSSRRLAFAVVGISAASHALLDMITNGGLGVALWWPGSNARIFAPWRVIEVSPLSLHALLGPRGITVLGSELLWVWLPALLIGGAMFALRRLAGPEIPPETLERRLSKRPAGLFILLAAGLWTAACLFGLDAANDTHLALQVWRFNGLALPLLFALGGALVQAPGTWNSPTSRLMFRLRSAALLGVLLLAGLACCAVIDATALIQARLAYEGSTSLSLATALRIAPFWAGFIAITYALRRWAPVGPRSEFAGRAALALMLLGSALPLLYLLSALPHIQFRT